MLVDSQSGCGDLGECHGSIEEFWIITNGGFACSIESLNVVNELLLFDITRKPQPIREVKT